ncbi:MAG: hypothetical protein ACTSUB_00135 [Candidatus Thorarchaeota archaeon]
MKEQESQKFSQGVVQEFLVSKIKKKGVLKKIPIETLKVYMSIDRWFRTVQFTTKSGNVYTSLVDELLSQYVSEFEDSLLLWRPKYVTGQMSEFTGSLSSEEEQERKNKVLQIVERIVRKRKESGKKLSELDESIKKVKVNLQSSVAFLLPKPPSSLRKDESKLAEWREESAIFIASSLVTNCPTDEEIETIELQNGVYVNTHLGIYSNNESGSKRIVALETTRAKTMEDAMRYGRALTRFCDICEIETEILVTN